MADLITDIVDQQAIDQVNRLKKALDDALASFNSLAGKNINLGGNVNGNAQQYLNEIARLQQQILTLTEQIGVAQTRNANTMGSGFKAMNDQYKQLRDTARELAVSQGRSSDAFKQAAKEAATAHGEIRKINSEVRSVSDNAYLFSGGLKNAWGYIRQIAYILPGIGIAGIFNLAFTAIYEAAQQLDLFKKTEEELIPLSEKLIENYKNWNDTIEWHNSRIDNETKLLIANAKLRKASIQEISDIEKNANIERMKQLDIELDNYNQQLVTLDRLINFKKVNSSSVSQSFDELNKAYKDAEEKRNQLSQKSIDLRTQMELNEINTKIELQKKAEEEAKKIEAKRKKEQQEAEKNLLAAKKVLDEARIAQQDEVNQKLSKLDLEYEEKRKILKKAGYTDFNELDKVYFAEVDRILDEASKKYDEVQKKIYEIGKKSMAEAAKNIKAQEDENAQDVIDLLEKYQAEIDAFFDEEERKKQDKRRNKADILISGLDITSSAISAAENKIKHITDVQLAAIDAREKAELDSLDRMTMSDKDRTEKKIQLELKYKAQRDKLHREEVAQLRRMAIFQKGLDLSKIAINTAVAVSKDLGMPWKIAADIAIGAAMAAQVLAQQIPQYAKGTDNHKGGMAIVGEEGTELGILPSGKKFLTKNKPTLMNLPAKTKIIPHDQLVQSIYHNALIRMSEMGGVSSTDGMQEALIASVSDLSNKMERIEDAILEKDMSLTLVGDAQKYVHLSRQLR